jgi:hypothetical protein
MKFQISNCIKKISKIAASITFIIGVWQFVELHYQKLENAYDGEWSMTSELESVQMSKYVGMKIVWVLHLSQTDSKLSGTTEKIFVNSFKLAFKERTCLNLQETIKNIRFILTFIEVGKS